MGFERIGGRGVLCRVLFICRTFFVSLFFSQVRAFHAIQIVFGSLERDENRILLEYSMYML